MTRIRQQAAFSPLTRMLARLGFSLSIAACGNAETSGPAPDPGGAGPMMTSASDMAGINEMPPLATRKVTGVRKLTFVTIGRSVEQPDDLTSYTIDAIVPNGRGGTNTLHANKKNDGTFSIDNVPVGSYWLAFQPPGAGTTVYISTSGDQLDLGEVGAGRADRQLPQSATSLNVSLTNLASWQESCLLEYFVANLGDLPYQVAFPDKIMAGDTTLNNYSMNFVDAQLPLLNSSKGDSATFAQFCPLSADPKQSTVQRFFAAPALTMTDGMSSTVSGMMTTVDPKSSIRLRWPLSQYAAQAATMVPSTLSSTAQRNFFLSLLPWGTNYGDFAYGPDVFQYTPDADTDLDQTFRYGNPYPASWPSLNVVSYTRAITVMAPGATSSTQVYIQTGRRETSATSPFTLRISPVRNILINGKDAWKPQTNIGLTPTLSWTAPQLGAPSNYMVTVTKLTNQSGKSQTSNVAQLIVKGPSVELPPSILTAQSAYLFTITAAIDKGSDTAPFRMGLPTAQAQAITELMQTN